MLQKYNYHRQQFAPWLSMSFKPLELTYLDKFHSIPLMKFNELLVCNCWLQWININIFVPASPTWKLVGFCTVFMDSITITWFFLTRIYFCTDIQCKMLLVFLNPENRPGKELQPFRLTLVLYRAAILGFKKEHGQADTFWAKRRHGMNGNIWTLTLPDMSTFDIIFLTYNNNDINP